MPKNLLSFNQGWLYTDNYQEAYISPDFDDHGFEEVCLPHANKEVPYNYFDETMYQFISCYRKHFVMDPFAEGKRVFIQFEGVMTYCEVYLNGHYVGEHFGGYTGFSFDLTDFILMEGDNVLTVKVDSTERPDIPPFGFVVDYLTFGGIYREVGLRIVDQIYMKDLFVKPLDVMKEKKALSTEVCLYNPLKCLGDVDLKLRLYDHNRQQIAITEEVIHLVDEHQTVTIEMKALENIVLWSIEYPNCYEAALELSIDGVMIDTIRRQIGFRQAEFTVDGFYLNGNKVKLVGLNRHQSFPYVGYAMPKRVQAKDADILKYDLGLNMVRTSHYPQSRYFLNRCDEIGLLVFEELPGWQHIGDEAWQQVACDNLKEMIIRDRNHPSIVLWGVRINESKDHHDFYSATNAIAHETDDTRPTAGVRAFENSECLEDVFTMNDFIQNRVGSDRIQRTQQECTGLNHNVPYLITEYGGHMYPTKRFDQEKRLEKHTLMHAKMMNAFMLDPHKTGGIGWCAFDYNTHYQFGSGDRICYHGVMDMFRLPKFAASAYSSQQSPKDKVVLEPLTYYTLGEGSGGRQVPITLMTNCDKVELEIDGQLKGAYYPAVDLYPGMVHPPMFIYKMDGTWGSGWSDGEFVGFVDGKEVIRRKYAKNPILTNVSITLDDDVLLSGDWDATRVSLKAVDQCGNLLPYSDLVIAVEVNGPGQVIGPTNFSLIGGARAFWIKTRGIAGLITATVKASGLEDQRIDIEVR